MAADLRVALLPGEESTPCTESSGSAAPALKNDDRKADNARALDCLEEEDRLVLWEEVKRQCYIALPMICVNLLQFLIQVTSVMLVGHLGELQLASASLATSFCVVTGFSFLMGMASGIETLCGQAFGARQYHLLGIYLQRAVVVLLILCVPIAVVWLNVEHLLKALGQDPVISYNAGIYARWLIPGLVAYSVLQPLVKFLQTQSAVIPMMLCSLFTLSVHIPLCWVFVYKLEFGVKGAAIAATFSNWLNAILLASYVKFSKTCQKTWTTFSAEAFQDFRGFFRLAIPSAVMICFEYWSFETLVLLSGILPNPQLETSAFSIILNTLSLCYMVPYGLSAAASTRVSNELGAGHPVSAKTAVCVTISVGLLDSCLVATLLLSTRNVLGYAFSNEEEVVKYVASLMPLTTLISVLDPIQGIFSGVARGCGWQGLGAVANLGAYYIVGLPLGSVLAFFFDLKGRGLWIGIVCGIATQATLLTIVTLSTNWQKQAREAWERVHREEEGLEEPKTGSQHC
ncbi:protein DETOXIFICATION 16 [Selaginella moellendorffii]|uniref:protein DETOXIFICATION 16 n=1 Tax=Selaginella moellendorffii TaxID=88036 RepID=UPI000D1C2988|nr:protein DETOXIFICATION 16 [Selaginella moellendorffii]|eukprot:XP_024538637.1 protein DETOXIFICATION 16 [Selaginella moellendorffii]